MPSDIKQKLQTIASNYLFWLILITVIAIIARSFPAWTNAAWGCDFGIYFGLTKDFVKTGELFNPYYGWGSTYNYFPVLYTISGVIHWISGIDVLTVMTNITPIFGGLTVLVFYFLCYELFKNKKIAILSSLVLAVIPFHVYQTSHASPLTMGHFFMILSLFFFLKYRKNTIFIYPLFLSTILLIMSHHLTTYFYLISLILIIFFENASRDVWTTYIRKDVIYVLIASISIFSYWIFIATPVFDGFINSGFSFLGLKNSSYIVLILFYLLFLLMFGVARLVRKISKYSMINEDKSILNKLLNKINPFIKKDNSTSKSRIIRFFLTLSVFILFLSYFIIKPLPWTGFPISQTAIILSIPMLSILALGLVGFRYTSKFKSGFFVRGWFFAIIFSLIFSIITNNSKLFPHRHFEYLMYPIAILAIFGLGGIFSDPDFNILFSKNKKHRKIKHKIFNIKIKKLNIFVLIFAFLIVTNAFTIYPSHTALGQSREEITPEDIHIIQWISKNININNTLFVSDHRLERMLEAEGFNTTKDEIESIWESENISEYFNDLYGINSDHGKVTHIVIDDIMKNECVHIGPKNMNFRTYHLTNDTWSGGYDKFKKQPFELMNRNESKTINQQTGEPIHWAEVYKINWTYIEEYLKKN